MYEGGTVYDGCVARATICIPSGDDQRIIIPVIDQDGNYVDIDGAIEIVFLVADELGGTVRFTKTLTNNDIMISTNLYEMYFTISTDDSQSVVRHKSYFELRLQTSLAEYKTILTGIFKVPETMIKDIP